MEQNPYEAPKAEEAAGNKRSGDERLFRTGVAMAAFSFVLPFSAWIAGHSFVAIAASYDPVPQGAMVIAFLGLVASIAVAVMMLFCGVVLAWSNRHYARPPNS